MFVGERGDKSDETIINLFKQVVFWAVHVACLGVLWVGVSWMAVAVCLALYVVRMFAITGGYHRYFSHRAYKTSRVFQFIMAVLGASSAQKGPIWWASHHRHHHLHSDTEADIHSPIVSGIYYAHIGWVLSSRFIETRFEMVKDWLRFPELRWLEKVHTVPAIALAAAVYFLGVWLEVSYPGLHTNRWQMLVWGFFISTVLLYHGTFCINSLTHLFGTRRFATTDSSRNNFWLALITLGEGWHNNHHYYPASASQGMYRYEIDITYYVLKLFSYFGLVWDLRKYPAEVYAKAKEGAASLPRAA